MITNLHRPGAFGYGCLNGVDGRLGAIDPRQTVQCNPDRLQAQAEAGELDTAKLQERLRSVFGDDGEGIVGEDGSVDYERLQTCRRARYSALF